ncbi:uncharacterized protein E0L32_012211 [Thyridium curvatum]|uniref:protein-ribulosamine 3-kinase n=1 Tax=Thyridium curvatum TaxID=1093900 RepID=A0A507BEZ4_9PEZI|nr:uncharacterized protein E0L32_012211 [Thyridium curvatum]TPX17324.1 hypothetical protein E0L32_012211 [Thyridium curvatum]
MATKALADPIKAQDVLAKLSGSFPMDEAVVEGNSFASVSHFGTSAWTVTGKVLAKTREGTDAAYFLKIAYGEHGGVMLKGEFESAKIIYGLMPGLIPQPFGYGRYKTSNPVAYFYLSEFIDMDITPAPDPVEFTTQLAALHKRSGSPNGRFGFHVVTCDGKMPHTVDWQDSWATFLGRLLQGVCKLDN